MAGPTPSLGFSEGVNPIRLKESALRSPPLAPQPGSEKSETAAHPAESEQSLSSHEPRVSSREEGRVDSLEVRPGWGRGLDRATQPSSGAATGKLSLYSCAIIIFVFV